MSDMKYIRTKDGIYAVEEKYLNCNDNELVPYYREDVDNYGEYYVYKKDIKQADTIEELCDEFCLYYLDLKEMGDNESWIPYATYQTIGDVWQKMREEIIEQVIKTKSVLYGAIWTSKGLIYVAKMNDKGELELI